MSAIVRAVSGARIPLAATLIAIGVWELLARSSVAPSSVAAPSEVVDEFAADPGGLWFHVYPTLSASLQGLLVASVLAFAIATVTVASPRLTGIVYSVSMVTYSVPLIALAPVLIVWIGNGPQLQITIAAIAGFFPVLVGCVQGFRSIDAGRSELLLMLSASAVQRFRRLVFPESLPYVFAGMKVAAASAVLGAIISEWAGATRGLGFAMISALSSYDPSRVWMTMVAATVLTIVLYRAVGLVERFTVGWQMDRAALPLGS